MLDPSFEVLPKALNTHILYHNTQSVRLYGTARSIIRTCMAFKRSDNGRSMAESATPGGAVALQQVVIEQLSVDL